VVTACWTQLGELRDAYAKFQAAGIELYAISYDDQKRLARSREAGIP
jgi:peroxiredoxin